MTELKKQRTVWLSDEEFKKLKMKAQEFYNGKGYLEKFLRKIGKEHLIFIEGEGKIKIHIEK